MRYGLLALTVVFLGCFGCLLLERILRRGRRKSIRSAIRIALIKRYNTPMTTEEILVACNTFTPGAVHAVIENMLAERSLTAVAGRRYRMR